MAFFLFFLTKSKKQCDTEISFYICEVLWGSRSTFVHLSVIAMVMDYVPEFWKLHIKWEENGIAATQNHVSRSTLEFLHNRLTDFPTVLLNSSKKGWQNKFSYRSGTRMPYLYLSSILLKLLLSFPKSFSSYMCFWISSYNVCLSSQRSRTYSWSVHI